MVLAAIWSVWAAYAWLTNVVDPEEGAARGAMLVAIGAAFIAALAVPRRLRRRTAFSSESRSWSCESCTSCSTRSRAVGTVTCSRPCCGSRRRPSAAAGADHRRRLRGRQAPNRTLACGARDRLRRPAARRSERLARPPRPLRRAPRADHDHRARRGVHRHGCQRGRHRDRRRHDPHGSPRAWSSRRRCGSRTSTSSPSARRVCSPSERVTSGTPSREISSATSTCRWWPESFSSRSR